VPSCPLNPRFLRHNKNNMSEKNWLPVFRETRNCSIIWSTGSLFGYKKIRIPKKKVIDVRNLKDCLPNTPLKTRKSKKKNQSVLSRQFCVSLTCLFSDSLTHSHISLILFEWGVCVSSIEWGSSIILDVTWVRLLETWYKYLNLTLDRWSDMIPVPLSRLEQCVREREIGGGVEFVTHFTHTRTVRHLCLNLVITSEWHQVTQK
jgi:hypothetical protein